MPLKEELVRVEKLFGRGSIMKLGDASLVDTPAISTGVLALDIALGVGGLPRGRVTEIYGPPGGGKSTIAQQVIAQAQLAGGLAAYVDAEHSLDPKYATALGVNINDLYVSQPDYGEQGLEIAQAFVRSNEVDVVVIDSVASLVPKAEIDGEIGNQYMGLQARMMSQAMRMLTADVSKSDAVVIFINQTRQKIGVVYGNPETTPGGTALSFYSSVRIDIRRTAAIKNGEDVIGAKTRAKVVKNKVGPPFKEAEFDIIYGQGAPMINGLVDLCTENGLISKSGAWYDVAGERFQGRDAVIEYLRTLPENARTLKTQLMEKLCSKE